MSDESKMRKPAQPGDRRAASRSLEALIVVHMANLGLPEDDIDQPSQREIGDALQQLLVTYRGFRFG